MCLPALVEQCKRFNEVQLVCGSYALPVWEWAKKHVRGADYNIVRVIDDPDDISAEFCPGYGFISMSKALAFVQREMPGETVIGHVEMGSYYGYSDQAPNPHVDGGPKYWRGDGLPPLELIDIEVSDGEAVVVHPYTRHDWKNLNLIIGRVEFKRPVKVVGLPGEFSGPPAWDAIHGFDAMVEQTVRSAGMVGILSSFTNLAALFHKKQIIVSFTPDIPILNPRAKKLITPSLGHLQAVVTEMGF